MKKILTAGIGIMAILAITYSSSLSSSQAMSSNDSTDFEYEYYYTDSYENEDSNMSVYTKYNDTVKDYENTADEYNLSRCIDTDPNSITVLINKEYSLPSSYIPKGLIVPDIDFYGGGNEEKKYMRKEAADAISEMFKDAASCGEYLYGVSGYRSYSRQATIYDKNVRQRGSAATNMVSAIPGHSEHQTGLAIDISCKELMGLLSESFADTSEGKWVQKNCHKYGFIVRYPKNKEKITGYSYEPWHIRYVGTEVSTYLHDNDITLEEYYDYKPGEITDSNIISDAATAEDLSEEK